MYSWLRRISSWACGLSPEAAARWGQRLGRLFWWLVPAHRKRLARENIRLAGIAVEEAEVERIARASAVRFGPLAMEVFRFPVTAKDELLSRIRFEHTESADAVEAAGTGCIFAASHAGPWEVLGAAVASRYSRLVAVGQHQADEGFDRFIREARQLVGQTTVYSRSMRDILRLLDEGNKIALLCDQDGGSHGILSPLLGTVALTVTGPAVLSYSRRVPIIPVDIYTEGSGYRVVFGDAVYTRRDIGKREAIAEMTAYLNEQLSQRVRAVPEDWFWLHNRWKWTRRLYGDPCRLTTDSPRKREQS